MIAQIRRDQIRLEQIRLDQKEIRVIITSFSASFNIYVYQVIFFDQEERETSEIICWNFCCYEVFAKLQKKKYSRPHYWVTGVYAYGAQDMWFRHMGFRI